MKKRPTADDPAAKALTEDLQKEDYHAVISEPGHYSLLTNTKTVGNQDTELKKKLVKLEEVYTTFFLWHALKGQQLSPPDYRLTVVLVDAPNNDIKDFKSKHALFNFATLIGSGFTAQRDNVVIYTPRRLRDLAYDHLEEVNQKLWNNFNTKGEEVLTYGALEKKGVNPQNKAVLQTLALCQKAMSDESETLTLSHLGVRQLIAATGLLPRNLQTAEWAAPAWPVSSRFRSARFTRVTAAPTGYTCSSSSTGARPRKSRPETPRK